VRHLHHSLFESKRSYREAVRVLAGSRILDTRYDVSTDVSPSTPGADIESGRNVQQVLLAVYQVRNNLLHGGKHPGNPRDADVVQASHVIISQLMAAEIKAIAQWDA
jgi:hypothetical protein